MYSRDLIQPLERYLNTFPAVLLGGSRQVGKTTLVREFLSRKFRYVLLEDPDLRALAKTDPRTFLERHPPPVIFDEFQNVPELVSYLQGMIDEHRQTKGMFILTGSQNFLMMEQVSQSLAGRIGILTLYGLNSNELPKAALSNDEKSLGALLLRGCYPELWATTPQIHPADWYGSYVQTYLEKDIRRLVNVSDLSTFERFLRVCAAHTGQELNISNIANDCGASPTTVTRWISVLEATYLIRTVPPYLTNLSARIRKTPKFYFMDTGLAAYLMGFRDEISLMNSPQKGALFETLVVADIIKKREARGEHFAPYYLQTQSKVGADLVIEDAQKLTWIEIKSSRTLMPALASNLVATAKRSKNLQQREQHYVLAMPIKEQQVFTLQGVKINALPWYDVESVIHAKP